MIDELKPHQSFRETGVPWVNELPNHWGFYRLKSTFSEIDQRSGTGEQPLLSLRMREGLVDNKEVGGKPLPTSSLKHYKVATPGQLVMNRMRAASGLFGVPPKTGLVSPDYSVFRTLRPVALQYFLYLFRTPAMMSVFRMESRGLGTGESGFLRLYTDRFGTIVAPSPPLEEQFAIVKFLKHANRVVTRFIRAKQKLTRLLEEQVQVKVDEAMKHPRCKMARLGRVSERHFHVVNRIGSQNYTALGLYNRGRGIFHKKPRSGSELGASTFHWVSPGDMVISGQFAWEGSVALASETERETVVSHRYYLLSGIDGLSTTPYLVGVLQSDFGKMLLNVHSRGAAGRNRPLNLEKLLKEQVPLPPHSVQLALGDFVTSLDPVRKRVGEQIRRLEEYKARLIADVVTGKLDVREAAAKLPDIADEPDELDGENCDNLADDEFEETEE